MTDLAIATRGIVLRRRSSAAYLELDPALELGAGGEARVYEVPGLSDTVAKLYREPSPERARKLELMLANPPVLPDQGGTALAWPTDLLLDARGEFAGFLMPRAEGPRVFELYNPTARRRAAPLFHWALLHRAGANLAAAFAALHARGYVVGDVNESNILLAPDGAVTLVDADSFQVRDASAGFVFRSHVGKAEFTPPELQGKSFAAFDRTPEHDRFGLAVLIFLLLMEGNHPFAMQAALAGEDVPSVEERIRRRLYPHAAPNAGLILPPRLAPSVEILHPALRELFSRAFIDGHLEPSRRPSAGAWREALGVAEAELATCARNPQHRHGAHLEHCPWCERMGLLHGRDPFPATVAAARATELATLRRAPAPPSAAPAPLPSGSPPLGRTARRMRRYGPPALPAAFQHPLVGMAPAFVVVTSGLPPALQGAAAIALVLLILRWWSRPRPAFTAVTALATAALALLALLMVRIGASPARPYYPEPDVPPVIVTPPARDFPEPEWTGLSGTGEAWQADDAVEEEPDVLNRDEVREFLTRAYPRALREAGRGGEVRLRFRIDPSGFPEPEEPELVSATDLAFLPAARAVVPRLRFSPARVNGEAVSAWVTIPITFDPGS